MSKITVLCPAKINLTLSVKGRRPDNYHELETIMQSISLVDTLQISSLERASGEDSWHIQHPQLPKLSDNLIYRAAEILRQYRQVQEKVQVQLIKRIPVAAGLAGGSTDAAGVLRGLNQLWQLGLSWEELTEIGQKIGSDVPFCLQGGTALARGRGEKLFPLPEASVGWWLVLVKPSFSVSTAEVYQNLKMDQLEESPETSAVIAALKKGDLEQVGRYLHNDLEQVTLAKYPQIQEIKAEILALGAWGALMSGSGPTVFGLAENRAKAEAIAEAFHNRQSLTAYTAYALQAYQQIQQIQM